MIYLYIEKDPKNKYQMHGTTVFPCHFVTKKVTLETAFVITGAMSQ